MNSERTEETTASFGLARWAGNKDDDKGFRFLAEGLCAVIIIILAIAYLNGMFGTKSRPSIQATTPSTEILPQKKIRYSADEPVAKTLFAAKMSSSRLVNDAQVNAAIKEVLFRLKSAGTFPWPVRVVILETHDVNAFTSGSGYVLLSSGLLNSCRTDGELAFVLSHELAHALLKHVPKKMERTLSDEEVEELVRFSRSNTADLPPDFVIDDQSSGSIMKGSQKASQSLFPYKNAPDIAKYAQLVLLAHYDADQELEADRLGVETMKKAGYSASESASLLRRLPDLSSWFSSNLSNKVRVAAIEQSGPNQFLIRSKRLDFTASQDSVTDSSGGHSTSRVSKGAKTPTGRIIDRGGLNIMTVHAAGGDKVIIIEAGIYSPGEQTPGTAAGGAGSK